MLSIVQKGIRKDITQEEFVKMVKEADAKIEKGAPEGNQNAAKDGEGSSDKATNQPKAKVVGSKVKIVGQVDGKGKSGKVVEVSPSGKYFVVDVGGKRKSFHNSDLK